MGLYFSQSPPPVPKEPEPPPVELGRCRYCSSLTERAVVVGGLELAFCCPKSACIKDHRKETGR